MNDKPNPLRTKKRDVLIGCFGQLIGLGVPGCIFVWMVTPVGFALVQDLRTYGVALFFPNQPGEVVEAAISDIVGPEWSDAPPDYVPGTCEDLQEKGLRNFFRGEPNYTPKRDPDGNGLACEDW